jgi:acetyl-CoA C-acetyltransferase
MSKNLVVSGYYTTKFGELWEKSLTDLIQESIYSLLSQNNLKLEQVDAIFFANMLGGILENNLHLNSKIAEILKINIPIFRVESACSSGGFAFHLACNYIKSGSAKTVLVIGAEKMTDYGVELVSQGLAAASSGAEQYAGLTFPGLYGILAKKYLEKYNYQPVDLARIAVQNHFHGSYNKSAQYQSKITLEDVANSPLVADPLRVLDCSPISDGASSLILTVDEKVKSENPSMQVVASQVATDTISLNKRDDLLTLKATQIAAQKAFLEAKLKHSEIDVLELHDCFTIAQAIALEDIGFVKKGDGANKDIVLRTSFENKLKTKDGFERDSQLPIVNTSGGLKAAGHPVAATGIKQIGEVYFQLTNQAQERQIKNAQIGMTHNVGGSGGSCAIHIFKKNN